jgi:molybdopterin molybdotransferase
MQNVSRRGEDYSRNEIVVEAGTVLKPWHIAAIASIGRDHLKARRRLRIGVLSTGSEVVEPGQPLKRGQISNSTKPMLLSFTKEEGCEPVDLGTVSDDLDSISESIAKGLRSCDMVLTTGGSSVGEKDLVQQAVSRIEGYKFVAHGIRLRPGRPTGVSLVGDKPVFILSGFPVAAMAAFQAVVKPTIRRLIGEDEQPVPYVRGILKRRVSNETGNRSYVRVRVTKSKEGLEVEPLMLTGSGLLSTLTKANALLIVSEEMEGYDEGEEVEVLLTGSIQDSQSE